LKRAKRLGETDIAMALYRVELDVEEKWGVNVLEPSKLRAVDHAISLFEASHGKNVDRRKATCVELDPLTFLPR
jgi:hypothetical protein